MNSASGTHTLEQSLVKNYNRLCQMGYRIPSMQEAATELVRRQSEIDRLSSELAALKATLALRPDPCGWMDADGRIVPAATLAAAQAGGATRSALAGYTIPLYPPA